MKTTRLFASLATVFLFTTAAQAVTIDWVTVGNPGNAGDTEVVTCCDGVGTSGYGAVNHVYRIGKYEVTADQYTKFLNAVAKDDPNRLYNTNLSPSAPGPHIIRSGSAPNFSYSVAADLANRPVSYVTFWDAARFVNWLHNGQPTGAQDASTTEDGAYFNIGNHATFERRPGAKYWIPTEDEWYKAAYHKNDGVTGNYWNYPTQSDTAPINTLPDLGNHANFYDIFGTGYTIGSPYYTTEVGAFENSPSPYGTFDQGGNVWEWNETAVRSGTRGVRGGSSFSILSSNLHASNRDDNGPGGGERGGGVGFRVASIPEPGSMTLCAVGVLMLALRSGRK